MQLVQLLVSCGVYRIEVFSGSGSKLGPLHNPEVGHTADLDCSKLWPLQDQEVGHTPDLAGK